MKRTLFLVLLFLLLTTSQAFCTLLTFDDLDPGPFHVSLDHYGGLVWENAAVLNGSNAIGTGYYNGVVSPPNVLYNSYDRMVSIYPDTQAGVNTFTPISGYFTSAFDTFQTVTCVTVRNNHIISTLSFPIYRDHSVFITFPSSSFSDITNLYITTPHGLQFALDNFKYIPNSLAPVPEPATVMLLGFGLTALFFIHRGRKLLNARR